MSEKKQKRLQAIRDNAFTAFVEHGFEAQMSDIARACKIGHGTLYRDFKDKDALYDHILQLEIKRAEEQWESDTLVHFTQTLFISWTRAAELFAHVPKGKLRSLHEHYHKVDERAFPLLKERTRLWRACIFQSALDQSALKRNTPEKDERCQAIIALFSESSPSPTLAQDAVQGWRS